MTKPSVWAFALCCASTGFAGCGDAAKTEPEPIDPLIGSPTGTFKTNLTGWHVVRGTWTETTAGEQGAGTSTSDAWLMSTDVGGDFTYEADLTITKGNAAQLIFRSQTQTPSEGAYVATISKNNNFVRLYEYPSGATLGTAFPLSVVLDKTYHMKVVALGSNIRVYVDGVNDNAAIIDVTDASPFLTGAFGLGAATSTSTFQNVNTGAATKSPFNTNLAGWAAVNGSWSTKEIGVVGTTTSGDAWYMSSANATDFAYEADLTIDSGNAAQLVFRSQATNPSAKGAYIATLSVNNNWARLLKFTGTGIVGVGSPVKFSDVGAPAVANKKTYHMRVLAVGSSIKVYISGLKNGAPLIDTTDTSFTSGFLGLAASNSTAIFQNVYKNQFTTNIGGWGVATGTWAGTPFGQQGTATTADAWYMAGDTGTDFTFESDVTIDSGNAAQLVFRAQSNKDLFKGAYVITLSTKNNWVKLLKYPGPGLGVTGVGDAFKFPTDTPVAITTVYHVKVVAAGSSIKVYVRGVNNDNALFERVDTSFTSGFFGVAASAATATFQNANQCANGSYYVDADQDGFGQAGSAATLACAAPSGMVANATDCNDASANVNPTASESCNGVDDNCSGTTDEGVGATYFIDTDGDGYGASAGPTQNACVKPEGYSATGDDCDDADVDVNPSAVEVCNARDDDCNDEIDDTLTSTYFVDADGDGFGDPSRTVELCWQPSGYTMGADDCDDTDAAIHPFANEKCDGVDENCDGNSDAGLTPTTYHEDADGDGFGDPNGATQPLRMCASCQKASWPTPPIATTRKPPSTPAPERPATNWTTTATARPTRASASTSWPTTTAMAMAF